MSPTHYSQQKSSSDTDELSTATTVRHYSPEHKPRPRSCVEPGILSKANFKLGEDVTSIQKKRWSGISLSSKLYQAYNNLVRDNSEEDYTDSLETGYNHQDVKNTDDTTKDGPESLDSNVDEKPLNGKRFKKLQKKWEMLSGKESQSPPESPTNKSKIPRFVPSPNKPSGIPVPITATPSSKSLPKTQQKKVTTPPGYGGATKRTIPSPITKQPSDKCITKKVATTTR